MGDWITWYQCPHCGNTESKLKNFKKIGKIEMEDGRKLTHYRCPSCKSQSPREDLYRCFNVARARAGETRNGLREKNKDKKKGLGLLQIYNQRRTSNHECISSN